MAKIESLVDVGSLANTVTARAVINANSQRIEDAFQNTLSRDGSLPNQMEADLDLNGNYLLNVADANSDSDGVNLRQVQLIVADAFNGADPGLRVDLAAANGSDLVTYTPPSTGVPVDLTDYLDALDAGDVADIRADLATSAGSGMVGFLQAGTGAVLRTQQAKDREIVSIRDFGALGGGNDDTAAIQAALDSGAKNILVPSGTWRITAALTVSNPGIMVHGDNFNSSIIRQDTLSAEIFHVTAGRFTLKDIGLDYNGTPTAGATAIYTNSTDGRISNLLIARCYTGIYTTGGSGLMADNFQIQNYVYAGVHCQTVNDVYFSKFILNAGNATNGAGGGIRLEEKVEAAIFTDGDVILGVYSLLTTSAANTVGVRPAYNNFTNVYLDSSTLGSSLTNLVETEFVGCWFSGGRVGAGAPGLTVNVTDSVNFVTCRFFNCGSHGCQVNSGAVRTTFVACKYEANSVTTGVGVSHGLIFGNNTADFTVIGGKAHNGLFSGQQGYGIFISANCDRFSVRDVQVNGNSTGGINDGTTNTNKTFSGNIGYVTQNKGNTNVAVGQTVATVTHGLAGTPLHEDIIITPTTLMSASSITSWRVTGAGATTFQVQTNAAVAGTAFTFSWKARIKGD